jgi:hypothetical protein
VIDPEATTPAPRARNTRRKPAKPRVRKCVCGHPMAKGPLELTRDGVKVIALWWCADCHYAILKPQRATA